jgi:CTP synthase (UTP-ammonia lyase)
MRKQISIGLIGDKSEAIVAHAAIPLALEMASRVAGVALSHEWLATDSITSVDRLRPFDGLWCVPGSPYRSMEGALLAIRHARERRMPFLGTCGGFQHAVIEYARNVLGWSDAEHGESSPDSARAVISPLTCGLLNDAGTVLLVPGSRLAAAYDSSSTEEEYLCRYGVNPEFRAAIVNGPLRMAATDTSGDLRGVELEGHPFYVATLFQPERAALKRKVPPLVVAFVNACAG